MQIFKHLFISLALAMPLLTHAQTETIPLNSADIEWQLTPQADAHNAGTEIATPGYKFPSPVKGVVPGVVFTAYVQAGKVPDPNYADNIWKVDESFYNRPFWYRTEFALPPSFVKRGRIWLHFDNTNRYADFYFNGTKLS